jgi:hypothetical protein
VSLNLEKLLKLRTVVARFGELSNARWWNTQSQLGKAGAAVLRRGFPRTHRFAQARSVFAVAAHRCDEVFNPPGCATLWRLPDEIEESFEAEWERWLERSDEWEGFFERVAAIQHADLTAVLRDFDLAEASALARYARTRRSAEGRALPIDGLFGGSDEDVELLALGFARGDVGTLSVPYMKLQP